MIKTLEDFINAVYDYMGWIKKDLDRKPREGWCWIFYKIIPLHRIPTIEFRYLESRFYYIRHLREVQETYG